MVFRLIRQRVRATTLGMSVALLAATAVLAEDQTTPAPASPETTAPAAPVEQGAAPAGQGGAAPAEQQKPTAEQQLPSPQIQEALVRSTLLSFSDASMTGNWSVFLADASDRMREVVSVDKLQAYTGWVTPLNDPSVLGSMPLAPQLAVINNGNVLYLKGTAELRRSLSLPYELQYVMTAKGWKLAGMHVVQLLTVPDNAGQQALLRSTLATYNDANISGDYSILYGKLPKAQRDALSLDKFAASTKLPNNLDLTSALSAPLVVGDDPKINENGQLRLVGTFKFTDSTFIKLDVIYIYEGEWKPAVINFDGHFLPNEGWAK